MELDLSKRRQMYKETRAACEQFHSKYNPPAVNDEVIEQFLNDTAHIGLEPGAKLIFFAGSCSQRFGWDGTSKVYRYFVDRIDEETDNHGTFIAWINHGLALMADESQEFEYRKRIADDVEKLLAEAGKEDDEWVACFWAQYYVKHPLRDDTDPKWLQQAATWCEISVNELRSRTTGELGPHELCELADIYRQLGRLREAAKLYIEALGFDLSEPCCENRNGQSIRDRLSMCRVPD